MRICVALLVLVGCKDGASPPKPEPKPAAPVAEGAAAEAPDDASQCPQQPFAESTPLAEASGAAWLTIDGKLSLVVVADSGHTGDYVLLDPETGVTKEQGKLPLGKLGDDIEGLAALGEKLFGLTSDGWMRVWERKGKGFELVDGPYAIGTEPDGTLCAPKKKCPINYEGLALAPESKPATPSEPTPATPSEPKPTNAKPNCVGFACSKGDGHLYCLVEVDGRYAIDKDRRVEVTRTNWLADCAFSETGTLWVGNNLFGLSQVFRIDGWQDPASAKVVAANAFGVGFPEVIAARGDVIYRMSDTGGAPSLMAKFRCKSITR